MCVVSNIGDSWRDDFPRSWPQFPPPSKPETPNPLPWAIPQQVSQKDIDDLRKEVEELKKLLRAAKEFDEKTGQKHCEMEDKVRFIKQVAKSLGVNLEDVLD